MALTETNFWSKVQKAGPDDCWLWTGSRDRDGYGRMGGRRGGRWSAKAHRVSYQIHHGPIPEGAVVRHICDTPACVNPAHLLVGTVADNSRDMVERGRAPAHQHGQNPNSKLTADDVENIRANRMNLLQRELAEIFGVNQTTISAIQRRKLWA